METEQQYPTGAAKWILVLTCVTCAVMELIDSTIVNVSLREISGNIGASVTEIGWVSTAYGIGNVIIIPLSGMLASLFGRRSYFTASVLVFTVTSLFCGLSGNLWMLVGWRFIQGMAGGGLLATALSIVLGAFPPEQAKTGFLIFALGVLLGPVFGPVLGGVITDSLSWHWIFFVNVPIGIIGSILSWQYITDLKDAVKPKKIDWAGIIFIAMALGSLQYVLEEGSIHDWFDSGEIRLFFTMSIVSFIAFIWRELSTQHPAVNLRLYTNFNLIMGNVIGLAYGIMANGTLFIFPLLAQISLGWTATKTGGFLITGGLAGAAGMILGKKLFEKVSVKVTPFTDGQGNTQFMWRTLHSVKEVNALEISWFVQKKDKDKIGFLSAAVHKFWKISELTPIFLKEGFTVKGIYEDKVQQGGADGFGVNTYVLNVE